MSAVKIFDILIVDDNEDNRLILKKFLEKNYRCHVVCNGLDAVEACQKKKFDLVLMDIRMPIMTGLESCHKIREFDKNLKVIAFSSEKKQNYQNSPGCFYPFDDFIEKPFTAEKMMDMVKRFIKTDHKVDLSIF